MDVFKDFTFEAAHWLPNVGRTHQCARMHGHSYTVTISVTGEVGDYTGWVVDYADISEAFAPILRQLDHHTLNDYAELSNPTAENLARWIWRRLSPSLPGLSQVSIRETPTAGCSYRGE